MAPVNSDLRSFCQDGTQIFRSYLRDGIKHCPDGSDEVGFAPPPRSHRDQDQRPLRGGSETIGNGRGEIYLDDAGGDSRSRFAHFEHCYFVHLWWEEGSQ